MSIAHAPSGEPIDVGGEIVVQCLEGQVAITDSAQTQKLHAGELLYLPAGEPHSVKGVEPTSLLLSIQAPEPNVSKENETIHARGMLLSVMQAVVLVAALALLFIAVAGNIFAGVLVVGAALVLVGCLHYWVWGRWMSPPIAQPRAHSPASHR
ncbi:MAG TPA: hypothetical protein VN688_34390 [Gemmataceae bacterium]|nr:hypothetical protein [Gemmataceae bacterium]